MILSLREACLNSISVTKMLNTRLAYLHISPKKVAGITNSPNS